MIAASTGPPAEDEAGRGADAEPIEWPRRPAALASKRSRKRMRGKAAPARQAVAAIVIGLATISLWSSAASSGSPIAAARRRRWRADRRAEGEYKIKPSDPGGMNVAAGDTASRRARGPAQGRVQCDGVPEARSPAAPSARDAAGPAPGSTQGPAQPAPARPRPRPRRAAQPFSSAPSQPGRRHPRLDRPVRTLPLPRPLAHNVVPATVGGRTVYRLRASGAGSADVCRRLRVAGEDCSVVS